MLDILLVDDANLAPIVGEVKIGGDQNLFYALVQGLMHVAALSGPAQRSRLVNAYGTSTTGLAEAGPIDLYLLVVDPPPRGIRPQLATLAEEVARGLMQDGSPSGVLRRIACLVWEPAPGNWAVIWRAGA